MEKSKIKFYNIKRIGECSRCGKRKALYSTKRKGCGTDTTFTADWTYRDICHDCVWGFFSKWYTIKIVKE